ncbi:lytic transglycosylase domain-containing protein [Roseovarius rhodophyticola]|uniref:Lytic transglycosylase domain-containing protein n=1 Tax=Roseovarius rhodophyticola TaxID=3080827 RepID=A0ABZ2TAE7_9RHOB|nr:lytic transglycosylase domain-containing protein [Roseovarius sp. W115]MDV2930365.1 lytic transglycosylase domain-containing protein [Roseovarius sp. W115]
MLRTLSLVFAVLVLSPPVLAGEPAPVGPRPLSSAFDAMQAGRWSVATRLAERSGPGAAALIEWHRLREGYGSQQDILNFLKDHPDWPGLELLRRKSELTIAQGDPKSVIAFFENSAPQSGRAALGFAEALRAEGREGDAEVAVVLAWRTLDLTTDEHNAFMKDWAELLKPHHKARLDMALWRGLRDVALMLPLVDDETRALAEIRQSIEAGKTGALKRLEKLPKSAKSNPHVAYALFNRHIKRGERDEAIKMILRQSREADGLGQAERWAGWRRELARDRMRDGAAQTAYDLAATHGLVEGSHFADLEWLAGFIALTDLNDPETAVAHFQRFMDKVETPISLGRAGYWLGRAQEAMGNAEGAALAYELGALHQTSFYGLLAAERGGFPSDPELVGDEEFPDWRTAEFTKRDVFQAGLLAYANGRQNLAERFFRHLALDLNRTELGQLGDAMAALGSEHLQVMVSKTAARRGVALPGPYYPLHPLKSLELPVPAELSLAIARRESEFDQTVTSGAGAMGLMQLMPATAAEMARAIGATGHNRARVFEDWKYNAKLGAEYLARMAQRFDGNIVMMAAAYNAGPSRPSRWMSRFGDPRRGGVDVIDWIEHIPFNETRNYVMRVAESLPVYRARLGRDPHPVPFSQELTGSTFSAALD